MIGRGVEGVIEFLTPSEPGITRRGAAPNFRERTARDGQ